MNIMRSIHPENVGIQVVSYCPLLRTCPSLSKSCRVDGIFISALLHLLKYHKLYAIKNGLSCVLLQINDRMSFSLSY